MSSTDKKLTPTAQRLAQLGISRPIDALLHLPLRYEDLSEIADLSDCRSGQTVQLEGTVTHSEITFRPRRQLVAMLNCDGATLALRFLHFYPNTQAALRDGQAIRVYGELRDGFYGLEMVHPKLFKAGAAPPPAELSPVYSTVAGLPQAAIRKAIDKAFGLADISEVLPPHLNAALGLPSFAAALKLLHAPPADEPRDLLQAQTHPAWQKLKFEELLAQQTSLQTAQAQRALRQAPALINTSLCSKYLAQLPFALTGDQAKVWREISGDLAQAQPMCRLLQGDVGSGKTVIAALSCLAAISQGFQAAMMAPTEVLAQQHYSKLTAQLAPLGVKVQWLAGSMKPKEKAAAHAAIASGAVDLIIGTHALIQDAVQFKALAVAAIDEQHRFGVAQRLSLLDKSGLQTIAKQEPHILMMSATPIPRTLAMTYYADLNVSSIRELPPGRTPIKTTLLAQSRRAELISRVAHWLAAGKQAYWVCPLIEESEMLQAQTATETYELLQTELPDCRIGLIHGQLKAAEKAAVMQAFAQAELDLLVATTVIEVGVDVPNASLMVIENAERFGLSQLHQLRGRVGRGAAESVCVLLYGQALGETGRQRLNIMRDTVDGFVIAQEDLKIRGPGEVLGRRQSGAALLRFADPEEDQIWLSMAQNMAQEILASYPEALAKLKDRWLIARQAWLNA